MRPKPANWWDYRSPAQKHWTSASKRGARTSIGPKILLAAILVVAGAIGLSGIDPQVVDAEWTQDSNDTHLPKMPSATSDARAKRSGIVAAIPLPPARAPATTGFASVSSSGPAPASELSQLRTSEAIVEPPAAVAIPKAEAVSSDAAAATATKSGGKPRVAMVKKKVVRVEHRQRPYSGAYAQYGGGWGGWGGGRGGWSGF